MNQEEITYAMHHMQIIVDSREQDTEALHQRIQAFKCPCLRRKLDFGDYTATATLKTGGEFCLEKIQVIERKESLSELCMCYTQARERFTKEFERAANVNAKTYLLVEKSDWEKIYAGAYRSKMTPAALVGSLTTWLARYNCQLLFCKPETSGRLIYDVLCHEMKEALCNVPDVSEEELDASIFY